MRFPCLSSFGAGMNIKTLFPPINKIIKILILSDFIVSAAFGLVAPIFALFLVGNIQGGTIETVGFSMAFYWLAVVFTRLPIARRIDRTESEKDDFYFMIIGSFLISIVPFLYLISSKIWHIYLIQLFYGLGYSLRLPGWYGMFTRHIDKKQEGYDWSMDTVLAGIGTAITAALGGILAKHLGFEILFILIGTMAIFGSVILIFLYYIIEPNHSKNIKKEEKELNKELSLDGRKK